MDLSYIQHSAPQMEHPGRQETAGKQTRQWRLQEQAAGTAVRSPWQAYARKLHSTPHPPRSRGLWCWSKEMGALGHSSLVIAFSQTTGS